MRVELPYRPIPIHADFHRSRAAERCLFGGYGSGKSWALCAEALAVGLEQPGSEILVTRKTVPSLRDTTEATFTQLLMGNPKLWDACETTRAGGHYQSITLPNGTVYLFRGMDDWKKLKSLNLAWIFWDEADEFTEEDITGMMSRIRQTNPLPKAAVMGAPRINRRGMCFAANPAGHNYLWKRFVSEDRIEHSEWFKSTSLDNPHLPVSYIDSLLAMPDPWVRRYVLCDFDEFGGQIYEDWDYSTHVIRPYRGNQGYRYPSGAWMLQTFDPGTESDNAALWVVYDPDKHMYVGVAEYSEKGLAARQHADAWRRIEAQHRLRPRQRLADPKAVPQRDRGSNMSLRDQYRRLGFHFQNGVDNVDTRVWALGGLIFSGQFKVTDDCPRTHEQIQNYRWEDLTPLQRERGREAKPLKKNVDLVDCAQYAACRYTSAKQLEVPEDTRTPHERLSAEVRANIKRQLTQSARYGY